MTTVRARRVLEALVVGSALAACDQGSPELSASSGPPLHITSSYPGYGAGLDCAPDDLGCGVPRNVAFEFRFDRFLRPDTAIRQAMTLYTGSPSNIVPSSNRVAEITPEYDLVERVVRFSLPDGVVLHENALYTFQLAVPDEEAPFGFTAFDGAALAPDTPRSVSFATSDRVEEPPAEPSAPSCDVVLALFAGCASAACHGGETPRMGLDLTSAEAIRRTAIGRVAHQTEVADSAGVALQDPARMGAAMPIIDPYRPDNSYLLYKLLISIDNYAGPAECESAFRAPVDPELCTRATDAELARLRDGFVRGEPMPHPASTARLGADGVRSISRFIRAGASCP